MSADTVASRAVSERAFLEQVLLFAYRPADAHAKTKFARARPHPHRPGQRLVVESFSYSGPTRPGSYPIVLVSYEIVRSK
jgi:hypothetical protein